MVTLETLIESQIVRISLDKANAHIEVDFLSADGQKRWRLVAEGVVDFLMEDVRLNNIIDDIFVYGADDANSEDAVATLHYLLKGKEITPDDTLCPRLQAQVTSLKDGVIKLWIIRPIYGAAMFVLGEKILINEDCHMAKDMFHGPTD